MDEIVSVSVFCIADCVQSLLGGLVTSLRTNYNFTIRSDLNNGDILISATESPPTNQNPF